MMYQLDGKLVGIAPILFNRFTERDEDAMEKRKAGRKKTADQKREQALERVYPDGNGGLGLPGYNLIACLLEGCRMLGLKRGRRGLAKYLEATVAPSTDAYSFGVDCPDGIDRRPGRNPNSRAQKVIIYRPYLDKGWKVPFALTVTDDSIPQEDVQASLEYAGLYVGLCDYRPRFGRFMVEWEEKPCKEA